MSRIKARSCIMSLMETPTDANNLHKSDIPPGRSDTVTINLKENVLQLNLNDDQIMYFNNRPSAAKPRSRQRPKIVVSMFPPQSKRTTLHNKMD